MPSDEKCRDFPVCRVPNIRGGVLSGRTTDLFEIYVANNPTGPMTDWARSFLTNKTAS